MTQHHEVSSEEDTAKAPVISERTPVQVGVVITIVAGLIGWTWWASNMSAKMDVLITGQRDAVIVANTHSKDISELQAWRKLVDTVGTPAMAAKSTELEKRVDEIARRLDLHEATSKLTK